MGADADEVLHSLGTRVKQLRTERGFTLRRLSERSGVSERFLSELEAGRGNISVGRLVELAQALGTQAASLLVVEPQPRARIIALLGLRGAGKSTIGPKLAYRLGLPFFELDGLIEARAGLTVSEIFDLHGEESYRRLEREVLEEFLDQGRGALLAIGGGVVNAPETFRLIEDRCVTVWLRADAEDHLDRVVRQGDARPTKDHPEALAELKALLARREPLYGRSQLQIDTSRMGVKGSVDALAQALAAPARKRPPKG